jgi:hypothetical protein
MITFYCIEVKGFYKHTLKAVFLFTNEYIRIHGGKVYFNILSFYSGKKFEI